MPATAQWCPIQALPVRRRPDVILRRLDSTRTVRTGNYRVLVPDLYKGKVGVDAEEASHVRACAPRGFARQERQQRASCAACL